MKAGRLGWLLAWVLTVGWGGEIARGQAMPARDNEHMGARTATASTELTVTVDGKATTLSVADLKLMPQKSMTLKSGHSGAMETYTGVSVGEVLAKAGFAFESATAKQVYHSYVRVEGTDGYWVLYSASELEDVLRETGSMIALTVDGKPLAVEGALKMVVAGEKRPARWVRNLKSIAVVRVD